MQRKWQKKSRACDSLRPGYKLFRFQKVNLKQVQKQRKKQEANDIDTAVSKSDSKFRKRNKEGKCSL